MLDDHESLVLSGFEDLLAQIYDDHVVVPDVMEYYRGADALELHIDLEPEAVKKPSAVA